MTRRRSAASIPFAAIFVVLACGDDEPLDSVATTTETTTETTAAEGATSTNASTTGETTGESTGPKPAICGDGFVDDGEACDDGDDDDEDGCTSTCARAAAITWTRSLDRAGLEDIATDVAIDGAGRIIVVGFETSAALDRDQVVIALDPAGEVLWRRSYAGEAGLFDFLSAVVIDPSGAIYVGGGERTTTAAVTAMVRKISGDGELLWTFTAPSPTDLFTTVEALAFADGALFGVGSVELGPEVGVRCPARRFDPATGAALWQTELNASGTFTSCNSVAARGGELVAVGLAFDAEGERRALRARLGAATGVIQAAEMEDYDASWRDVAFAADGDLLLVGEIEVFGRYDAIVRRIDPQGAELWTRVFGGAGLDDGLTSVEALADGGALVGGYAFSPGTLADAYVGRLDAAGAEIWSSTYNNPVLSLDDRIFGIALGPEGAVAAGLETKKGEGRNLWVRAFGAP